MAQQRTDRKALRVHFESTVKRGAEIVNCRTSLAIYLTVELQLFVAGFDLEIRQ
jgi:hypothetical protein